MGGVQGISNSGVASDESAQYTKEDTLHFCVIRFARASGKSLMLMGLIHANVAGSSSSTTTSSSSSSSLLCTNTN